MLSLIGADFFQQYGLLIVLAVALAILMFISFNRRKKEEANRTNLNQALVPGAKVKTYGGVYGTIISIEETTDGKIVMLETGDKKHPSYQEIHINAIYGLDEKQPVILNENGEELITDLDKLAASRTAKQNAEDKKNKTKKSEEAIVEPVAEVAPAAPVLESQPEVQPEVKPAKKSSKKSSK